MYHSFAKDFLRVVGSSEIGKDCRDSGETITVTDVDSEGLHILPISNYQVSVNDHTHTFTQGVHSRIAIHVPLNQCNTAPADYLHRNA